MSDDKKPPIQLPKMCDKHESLLVHQAGYGPNDTWQACIIASQIALFQGVCADKKIQEQVGGDVHQISKMGCMACRKPDLFGQVVEAAKSHDLGKIKKLGEKWCGL